LKENNTSRWQWVLISCVLVCRRQFIAQAGAVALGAIMTENKTLSRRDFLCASSVVALAGRFPLATGETVPKPSGEGYKGIFCLFSKPFPEMNWRQLAHSAKDAGFGGIDLTVRKEGHVLPERVTEDLPKAVAEIRKRGLEVPMITTELLSAADPAARPIFQTAANLSIPFYKPGYYQYRFIDVRKELEAAGKEFRSLAELGQEYGMQAGFHNHAGIVGAPVWDIARVIDTLDRKWAGYYFDLNHATAEGGVAGWKIATNLVIPRLKMVAVKDFYWENTSRGWAPKNCPLGDGMCHWNDFLAAMAQANFHGPISLHLEYEIPGVSNDQGISLSRAGEPAILAAAKRDLNFLKARLQAAYGGGQC
jgi:sugar phosphate isomerase/epimerase